MEKYLESIPDKSQERMDMEKIIHLERDLTRQKGMRISSDTLIKSLESEKRELEAKLQSIERQINTIKAGR
jgi:SMC interacting uncharacterized protein involved in chromosome segregation